MREFEEENVGTVLIKDMNRLSRKVVSGDTEE